MGYKIEPKFSLRENIKFYSNSENKEVTGVVEAIISKIHVSRPKQYVYEIRTNRPYKAVVMLNESRLIKV